MMTNPSGRLEAVGDEMTFIQSIRPEQFERVDFTFFAADPRATRAKWTIARDLGNTIVDLTAALEERVRSHHPLALDRPPDGSTRHARNCSPAP